MAIYCNVEKCINWESIDEPVQQSHGIGYVPIGDLGKYRGTCGLNSVSVHSKVVTPGSKSSTTLSLSICSNFSESTPIKKDSLVASTCSQDACRYNRDTDDGLICERPTLPDTDVFFDTKEVYDGDEEVVFPVCRSYSIRHRSGVIDWSHVYETS